MNETQKAYHDHRPHTHIKQLDVLPLLKYYLDELNLFSFFDKYIPNKNNADIAPAQVLCVMMMNIVGASCLLYQVVDWLGPYLDGVTEPMVEAAKYNDDRFGRTLDCLFEADHQV